MHIIIRIVLQAPVAVQLPAGGVHIEVLHAHIWIQDAQLAEAPQVRREEGEAACTQRRDLKSTSP